MFRHVGITNYDNRFARICFLRLQENFFEPISIHHRRLTTITCGLPKRKNSTLFSKEFEKSVAYCQQLQQLLCLYRCNLRSSSYRCGFHHKTVASSTRPCALPTLPFTQRSRNCRELSNIRTARCFSSDNAALPLVSFSSISETPLDSFVVEKPYTLILMEDDASASFLDSKETVVSWSEIFRSKVPRDYGMSFASISLQLKTPQTTTSTSTSTTSTSTASTTASISKTLQALKASPLPIMADAILVARGPCSSLLAQYYLESFSLKGLVMLDPILLQEENDESLLLSSLVSNIYKDDQESLERFRSRRLLVEANSVPMMVVRTIVSDKDTTTTATTTSRYDHCSAWKASSLHVAERHGDTDGPYGEVPVLDIVDSADSEAFVTNLLAHIDHWIDQDLY